MKRILALDGGGTRGVFTLDVLLRIEHLLQEHYAKQDPAKAGRFVLRDHFDFLAGTSTGAIIATCLCWGMSVKRVMDLYVEQSYKMFEIRRNPVQRKLFAKFNAEPLSAFLQSLFSEEDGTEAILGSPLLRNGEKENYLMVVVRNESTGSAWPLTNNPKAKYNQLDRPDCNLRIPLWRLVRASTAAPTFFPAEVIPLRTIDSENAAASVPPRPQGSPAQASPETRQSCPGEGEAAAQIPAIPKADAEGAQIFSDGSITPYSNPALIAALTAILPGYRIGWTPGPTNIRVVSIGTLSFSSELPVSNPALWVGYYAKSVPKALLQFSGWQQDYLCRCLGDCIFGESLDSEVGDLLFDSSEFAPPRGRSWFSYVRYNHTYKKKEMETILSQHPGLASIDDVHAIPILRDVGREYAGANVKLEHLI